MKQAVKYIMGNSQNKNVSKKNNRTDFIFAYNSNRTTLPNVIPPSSFITEDEFFKTWCSWKNEFLTFKRVLNKENFNKEKWGNLLLNLMGPIGQNIHSTFQFNSLNDKENIDILLQKFDEYYIFSGRKKLPLENIYEYINDLQFIIKEKNIDNEQELIRKKILAEINEHQFNNAAKRVIPTFTFSSDFNKLTIKEIAFIWKLYIDSNSSKSCTRCGSNHVSNKCPSLGKQCIKCNEWNHFPKRCPKNFITNCHYCGGDHRYKNCPAYNEICTKCQKLHHFSWKCKSKKILQCNYCGLTHIASRSHCTAKNIICNNCKTMGHISSKCNKKSNNYNHKN